VLRFMVCAICVVASSLAQAQMPAQGVIECESFVRRGSDEDQSMARAPDGAMWHVDVARNELVRVTRTQTSTAFKPNDPASGTINSVAIGKDGKIWYLKSEKVRLGWINANGSAGRELTLNPPDGYGGDAGSARGLRAAPNGELWFYDPLRMYVARVDAAGVVKFFQGPAGSTMFMPTGVAPAPDGTVWISVAIQNAVYRLNPANGQFQRFAMQKPDSMPTQVAVDQDSAVWVLHQGHTHGTRVSAKGEITTFDLGREVPEDLLPDGKGGLWFTLPRTGMLGYRAADASVLRSKCGVSPRTLAFTDDGKLWITGLGSMLIAKTSVTGGVNKVRDVKPDDFEQRARDSRGTVIVQFTSFDRNCTYCIDANGRFESLAAQVATPGVELWRVRFEPWHSMNNHPMRIRMGLPGLPHYWRLDNVERTAVVNGDATVPHLKSELKLQTAQ
jgi:streptogramin lyase